MSALAPLFRLAIQSLKHRRLQAVLCVLTVAISTALLLAVLHLRKEARTSFQNTLSGTDLIVGARTGSLPLLLYTVFHIGDVSSNIDYQSFAKIAADPRVAWAVPISLGDSHQGFRVVGTTDALFTHYRYGNKTPLGFQHGQAFRNDQSHAVIGAEVAKRLAYKLNDAIVVAHGLGRVSFVKHQAQPLTIVGILQATGTPVDQSIYVPLAALDAMHHSAPGDQHDHDDHDHDDHDHDDHDHDDHDHDDHEHDEHDHEHDDHEHEHDEHDHRSDHDNQNLQNHNDNATQQNAVAASTDQHQPKEITAFYLGLKIRATALAMQREINTDKREPLQAVLPTATLQQLWKLIGVAENAMLILTAAVIMAGLLSILISLWSSLEARRREMAILRSVGAGARHVFALLLMEGFLLSVIGVSLAALMISTLFYFAGPLLAAQYGLFASAAWWSADAALVMLGVVAAALLLCLIPAIAAYRNALVDGLTMRL
jgi:putative ABC transport system permease protein